MANKKQKEEKLHPTLYYEKRRVTEAQMQFDFISELVWKCDAKFGEDWIRSNIWSYGAGIEFKDLSQDDYLWVKRTLSSIVSSNTDQSKIGDFKKESSGRLLQLTKMVTIGHIKYIDDGEEKKATVTTWVAFNWGLPDTCEVTYKTETREVDGNSIRDRAYHVDEMDGKLYHTETTEVIKCNKPILEAVFEGQQQNV